MMLFGYDFTSMTPLELTEAITSNDAVGTQAIFTANVDHIVSLRSNPAFRDAYKWAWIKTIDGAPVLLYAKMRYGLKQVRITGSDLLPLLLDHLNVKKSRVLAVCPTQNSGIYLRDRLVTRGLDEANVMIIVPQFGFEHDLHRSNKLALAISNFKPSHLLFCLGAPKSELWVYRHRFSIGNCYVLCLGSAPSFLAGELRRAPRWMSKAGLEWLWRFFMEPKRLFRRYFINSWGFVTAIFTDIYRSRRNGRGL